MGKQQNRNGKPKYKNANEFAKARTAHVKEHGWKSADEKFGSWTSYKKKHGITDDVGKKYTAKEPPKTSGVFAEHKIKAEMDKHGVSREKAMKFLLNRDNRRIEKEEKAAYREKRQAEIKKRSDSLQNVYQTRDKEKFDKQFDKLGGYAKETGSWRLGNAARSGDVDSYQKTLDSYNAEIKRATSEMKKTEENQRRYDEWYSSLSPNEQIAEELRKLNYNNYQNQFNN